MSSRRTTNTQIVDEATCFSMGSSQIRLIICQSHFSVIYTASFSIGFCCIILDILR